MKLFLMITLAVCFILTAGGCTSLPTTHIVEHGDTLSDISMDYYGTMQYWQTIANENNIDDPRDLQIGDELIIPAVK